MNKQPIGASVSIKWLDQLDFEPIEGAYISFGDYNEETERDSYGIPDECVLYYCREDDLKQLSDADNTPSDFIVIDYKLEYKNEQI